MEVPHAEQRDRRHALVAPAIFALLSLAMFADVLVGDRSRVLSSSSTDLALQFIPWRQFGFSQLARGNLALWNPHIFGGAPYFAGFQSALLYLPNWLHLILPLGIAINWIIALHVFGAGYFTYLWARAHGVSIAGSILAGVMFMFSGPYFLHIYAGHLPHSAVMIWAPLILLAIDGIARDGAWRWCLLGCAAVAMQIFAGHPQYVYYTGIATTIYVALKLIASKHRAILAGGFVVICVGGALLAAVQLLPGIQAQGESIRSAGTGYEFASTFSFPPTNLMTAIAPNFLGRLPMGQTPPPNAYWGAGYLWEMSLFASVTGLVLAIYAASTWRGIAKWIIVIMIAITLLLALGRHTPLYRAMLLVPKYDSFRGSAKFSHLTVIFLSLLAGIGFDNVIRGGKVKLRVLIALAVTGLVVLILSMWLRVSPESWKSFVQSTGKGAHDARELFARPIGAYDDPKLLEQSARGAASSLIWAAATVILVAALLAAVRWRRQVAYSLVGLAGVELFIFACSTRATMPLIQDFPESDQPQSKPLYSAWREALRRLPREERALNAMTHLANASMLIGYDDVWGYDPGVQRRWAQLLAGTQGVPIKDASQYLTIRQVVPSVFRMLRCGVILAANPARPVIDLPDPLPVATVISDWVQIASPESAIAYMMQDHFDPRRTVVLEAPPGAKTRPAAEPPGSASVVAQDTDWLEIRAELTRPGILLITNSYSAGWRAAALSSGPQSSYQIVPANWALQAIPLEAGRHHLRLEYLPGSFQTGKWITIASLLVFSALLVSVWFMNRASRFR